MIGAADTAMPGGHQPRVSVLVTTYNGSRFIAETIDSILCQTFQDFELVVVDDGSTDDTADVVARFNDPRIRIIRNERNLGVVGSRNHGFRALRGAYVATVDHDDLWLPTRLEAGVAILDSRPSVDLVATQVSALVRGRLQPIRRFHGVTPMVLRWMLLLDCSMIYSSLLFRYDKARLPDGGFLRPDAVYADDYELMLRLTLSGDGAQIDEYLTIYRLHGGNTTYAVRSEMFDNSRGVLARTYARWLPAGEALDTAQLVARHVARRHPAVSWSELNGVGAAIERLLALFIATYRPGPSERRRIEEFAQEAYWRAGRATLRSGRIWLIGCYLRRRSLSILVRLPGDVALSLGRGLLRLLVRPGQLRRT
ncbi:MAG: glycosyltransferase family 2 protein [Acetobacteraceae bacterium]